MEKKKESIFDRIDNYYLQKYSKLAKKEEKKRGIDQFDLAREYVKHSNVCIAPYLLGGLLNSGIQEKLTYGVISLFFYIGNNSLNPKIDEFQKEYERQSLENTKSLTHEKRKKSNICCRLGDKGFSLLMLGETIRHAHKLYVDFNIDNTQIFLISLGFYGLLNTRATVNYLIEADPKMPQKDSLLTKALDKVKEYNPFPEPVTSPTKIIGNQDYKTIDSLFL